MMSARVHAFPFLDPTADQRPVLLVICAKGLGQASLLHWNHDPVEVRRDERKKDKRPELSQNASFTHIREPQAHIHGITAEAIWTPFDQPRGCPPGDGCGACF